MALDPVTTSFRIFQVIRQGIRNRRERRMGQVTMNLPDGSQVVRADPLIPGRTSTKVAVSGLAVGLPVIQWLQDFVFPWPAVEEFTNSDLFVQLATLAVAFVVARFSKSPAVPGVL